MEKTGERAGIVRAAGVVGFGTLMSRILGFIRDIVIAAIFGTGVSADAFFVAFRIPNLFRRLVGEGALTVAIIPVFTEYISTHSKEEVRRLVGSAIYFFAFVLLTITLVGMVFSPLLVKIISPGFIQVQGKLSLAIRLTRLIFPYLFFIGLVALFMGVLNSVRHFAAPAISPVWLNISIILSAIFLTSLFTEPVYALGIGVLIGGVIQLLFQLPFLRLHGLSPIFRTSVCPEPIRRIARLMVPAIVGGGVYQLNILVTTRFASDLASGSVSYLYYADRLVQFPLGIFGIALSTAVLPTISHQAYLKDWKGFKDSLSYSLRLVAFISIPSMVGLMVLGVPVISLLFQRGEFVYQDTINTADALFYYSFGLVAFGGVKIVSSAFYSMKDTKTPVKVGCIALIANIVFSLLLMGPLKHGGLALATSLASILNLMLLLIILRMRVGQLGLKEVFLSIAKTTIASMLMGITVYLISIRIDWLHGSGWLPLFYLIVCIIAGILVFVTLSRLLNNKELSSIMDIIRQRP